jgi:hypothetical protein
MNAPVKSALGKPPADTLPLWDLADLYFGREDPAI